jgi:hypothetical protein
VLNLKIRQKADGTGQKEKEFFHTFFVGSTRMGSNLKIGVRSQELGGVLAINSPKIPKIRLLMDDPETDTFLSDALSVVKPQ